MPHGDIINSETSIVLVLFISVNYVSGLTLNIPQIGIKYLTVGKTEYHICKSKPAIC